MKENKTLDGICVTTCKTKIGNTMFGCDNYKSVDENSVEFSILAQAENYYLKKISQTDSIKIKVMYEKLIKKAYDDYSNCQISQNEAREYIAGIFMRTVSPPL